MWPEKIEAALLYQTVGQLDAQRLQRLVNIDAAETSLRFDLTGDGDGGTMILEHPDLRVEVSQSDQPLAAEGFRGVLNSPFTELAPANLTAVVGGHHNHVIVSVSDGPALLAPNTQKTFETRLMLCRLVVNRLIDCAQPEAVHWRQSNQLFSADQFQRMKDDVFPLPLCLHPAPFYDRTNPDGTRLTGIHVHGSEHFLGKPLIFNACSLPFEQTLGYVTDFVAHCRKAGAVLADGDSFGSDRQKKILVLHGPRTALAPTGDIQLTYLGPGMSGLQPEAAYKIGSRARRNLRAVLSLRAQETALRDIFVEAPERALQKPRAMAARAASVVAGAMVPQRHWLGGLPLKLTAAAMIAGALALGPGSSGSKTVALRAPAPAAEDGAQPDTPQPGPQMNTLAVEILQGRL